MREEGFEPSRPFGHRILRLVRPGTDLGATCRPVSSGVTLCHPVSFRREQDVSENGAVACTHVYVERCPRIERVVGRLFEGEEAVLHVIERIVAPLGLRVDATSPWVDARLLDGSRVQTRFLGTLFGPRPTCRRALPPGADRISLRRISRTPGQSRP